MDAKEVHQSNSTRSPGDTMAFDPEVPDFRMPFLILSELPCIIIIRVKKELLSGQQCPTGSTVRPSRSDRELVVQPGI